MPKYSQCEFCNNQFDMDGTWWECKECGVCYHHEEEGLHVKWERTINNIEWALNIYPDVGYSVLFGCPNNLNFSEVYITEIEIPYVVKNVTPDTIIDKIKTIVTFS